MGKSMVRTPWARCLLLGILLGLSGCTGDPSGLDPTLGRVVHHEGEEVVIPSGRLVVETGERVEFEGGSLQLGDDPDVIVDGTIEVRGALSVRNATIRGLVTLTLESSGSLVLENVQLEASLAYPILLIDSSDAVIRNSRLEVHRIQLSAAATLEGNQIQARTDFPGVVWINSEVRLVGNQINATGAGVLLQDVTGVVERNEIRAGTAPNTTALLAVRSELQVVENVIRAADLGIVVKDSVATISGNQFQPVTQSGIAALASRVVVQGNRIEGCQRAGIYLAEPQAGSRVEGNAARNCGTGKPGNPLSWGGGIVVDGGSPQIQRNQLSGNDVGLVILRGRPVANTNNIETNRFYGAFALEGGNQTAPENQIDATNNWWGAPSGPVPPSPSGSPASPDPPAGAQRVGPGIRYAPWSFQPFPTAGSAGLPIPPT